jgi:hypothetical protein
MHVCDGIKIERCQFQIGSSIVFLAYHGLSGPLKDDPGPITDSEVRRGRKTHYCPTLLPSCAIGCKLHHGICFEEPLQCRVFRDVQESSSHSSTCISGSAGCLSERFPCTNHCMFLYKCTARRNRSVGGDALQFASQQDFDLSATSISPLTSISSISPERNRHTAPQHRVNIEKHVS